VNPDRPRPGITDSCGKKSCKIGIMNSAFRLLALLAGAAPANDLARSLELKRLVWAGPLTVLASCLAVLLIRSAAVAILKPGPGFLPLTLRPPIIDTVWGAGAAVLVFRSMCSDAMKPVNAYRALAAKALAVSLLPDLWIAILHGYGGGWQEASALVTMHVAVWVICVTLLPRLVTAELR
jgi:hypothetical protein